MEYRNSARGHLIALENKGAMECYLETMIQGKFMKQKAYGTLVSSEMHADRPAGEPTMESGGVLRRRNQNHHENTRSANDTLRENGTIT